jgi:hypothetical protein
MAVSSDLLHALKLNPQITRMLDVYDEGLQMWETQSISRIFKVASRIKILARRQGVTVCPMLDSLRASSGNIITSPAGSTGVKRKASETEGLDPDTPSRKRHHTPESPSPNPVILTSTNLKVTKLSQSRKFIQVPHGCTWPDGLLVDEVVQGFSLMARTEGDQATRFCTVFKGATWTKPTFSRHQAVWRGLSSKGSEEALRHPNLMWKDLYKKVKRQC